MAGKNTSVFGLYPNRPAVEVAVDNLRGAGFRSTDISALFAGNPGTKDLAHEESTKAPEGAAAGGMAGGIPGWLTGAGVLAIPGLPPLTAAGPVVAALAGAGAAGALGGIAGALLDMGVPEYEAKRYDGRLREGGVLLSAHCDSSERVKRARDILAATGATGISPAREKRGDFANTEKPVPRVHDAGARSAGEPQRYEERPAPGTTGAKPDDPGKS